ncbi:MAG: hypothetical protein H6502_01785 [Candidatus Woesearchaeota archaeon]|nr:MAG: hypothetical protein H6502_01785 [Candidatus Woesearchaeota archaeon]
MSTVVRVVVFVVLLGALWGVLAADANFSNDSNLLPPAGTDEDNDLIPDSIDACPGTQGVAFSQAQVANYPTFADEFLGCSCEQLMQAGYGENPCTYFFCEEDILVFETLSEPATIPVETTCSWSEEEVTGCVDGVFVSYPPVVTNYCVDGVLVMGQCVPQEQTDTMLCGEPESNNDTNASANVTTSLVTVPSPNDPETDDDANLAVDLASPPNAAADPLAAPVSPSNSQNNAALPSQNAEEEASASFYNDLFMYPQASPLAYEVNSLDFFAAQFFNENTAPLLNNVQTTVWQLGGSDHILVHVLYSPQPIRNQPFKVFYVVELIQTEDFSAFDGDLTLRSGARAVAQDTYEHNYFSFPLEQDGETAVHGFIFGSWSLSLSELGEVSYALSISLRGRDVLIDDEVLQHVTFTVIPPFNIPELAPEDVVGSTPLLSNDDNVVFVRAARKAREQEYIPEELTDKVVFTKMKQTIKKLATEKTYELDNVSNTTTITLTVSPTPGTRVGSLKVIEVIPKSLANSASVVGSDAEFIVLDADPILMWDVGVLDAKTTLQYTVPGLHGTGAKTIFLSDNLSRTSNSWIMIVLLLLLPLLIIFFLGMFDKRDGEKDDNPPIGPMS